MQEPQLWMINAKSLQYFWRYLTLIKAEKVSFFHLQISHTNTGCLAETELAVP